MKLIDEDPRVLSTAAKPGVLEIVKECNAKMDLINNGVNAYLEKKRIFFPRYYYYLFIRYLIDLPNLQFRSIPSPLLGGGGAYSCCQ